MSSKCPRCSRTIPNDSIYCPYCGHGIKASARSTQVSAGGVLMMVAATASLVYFVLSVQALLNIYNWYPRLLAQSWFVYDQMLAIFFFLGLMSGFCAAVLSLTRRRYRVTMASAVFCTISCGAAWIVSMTIPHSNPTQSLFYYFLPLLATAFIGIVLIFFRKAEFDSISKPLE